MASLRLPPSRSGRRPSPSRQTEPVDVGETGSTVGQAVSVFDDPLVRERVPWWESAHESERRAVYDALRFICRDPTATRCAGPLLAHHRSSGFGKPVLTCDACNLDDRTHALVPRGPRADV